MDYNGIEPAETEPSAALAADTTAVAEEEPAITLDSSEPEVATRPEADTEASSKPEITSPAPIMVSPPELTSVTAHAEPAAAPEPEAAPPETPVVNAPVEATTTPLTLADFLDVWEPELDNADFRDQLDYRILHVAAGRYEEARKPLTMVADEQQAIASRFIDALIAIRETHMGDPAAAATTALAKIESLRESLRGQSALEIPTLEICRAVRGFGQYEPFEPATFTAGRISEFVTYCELRDFTSQPQTDGTFLSRFDLQTTILTRSGDTVLEIKDGDVTDRCRNRRNDCFIPRLVRLPATLSPGEYVVKVTIGDKLGQKVAEKRAGFRIVAR